MHPFPSPNPSCQMHLHRLTCHPAHGVDDKRGLSLVGAENILYYLNIVFKVVFTRSFPIIDHFWGVLWWVKGGPKKIKVRVIDP